MIVYQDGQDIKNTITEERKTIQDFKFYESNIKLTLETYTKEFDNISFENEVLRIMILNNFDNAIMQVDSNLQDIESLCTVLDILENQDNISSSDIETYNKLFAKVEKDIELIQNFIQKSIKNFDNVPFTGSDKSLLILEKCKDVFSLDIPTSSKEKKNVSESTNSTEAKKSTSNIIKRDFDLNSSDLLCFFPKNESENLVISTMQDNYKISFKQNQATIYIKEENFHISLNTSGVQVSNSKTNNILFVSHTSNKYTIITNNQIEIPNFIQVSKISKNEDFLEVEFAGNNLFLSIKDNIIYFEQDSSQKNIVQKEIEKNKISKQSLKKENNYSNTTIPNTTSNVTTDVVTNIATDVTPVVAPVVASDIIQNTIPEVTKNNIENNENIIRILEPEENQALELERDLDKYIQSNTKTAKHFKEDSTTDTKNVEKEEDEEDISPNDSLDEDEITDNDTLIISDSNQKVILPYTIEDLEEKKRKNKKYKSLQDVIKNEYTLPLDTFKNPVRSRFKEAFQLIKKKEHGSLKEAIGLGFELMFQSDLNPAVIAACRDLDELDIYLDCLDDNELDKFSCFKIKYNVKPTKKQK